MLPNLKQCIYCSLGDPEGKMDTVEARLNLMQATFLTLQSSSDLTQDEDTVSKAQDIFKILFTRHFNESIEASTSIVVTLIFSLSEICSIHVFCFFQVYP